jgi:hypothetical protein
MKICYIISTCDKYLDTRVKYQMDTFLSDVDKNDIFYLTSKPNIEKRHFGWNCMDDSQNITWKYIHFIKNMKDILEYDWYIFVDDDTFIFIERLENLLSTYTKDDLYYIGNELDHIKKEFCLYMSGGGGYAISNGLYKLIYNYINEIGINNAYYPLINLKEQFCYDLCIGLWINELKNKHKIIQIDNKNFLIDPHKNEYELNNAITIHRTMTEESNKFYYNISKQDTIFKMKNYKIFCLSYNNLERKKLMQSKFEQLELNFVFYDGVNLNDNRIHPESYKKCWSCMYGHLDMIKMFYNDTELDYGIFCEDDIYIHKDLKKFVPQIIKDFKHLNLDILLLGYLVPFQIKYYYNGFHLKNNYMEYKDLHYHNFTDDVWGTQMYMLSKKHAQTILEKYDESSGYALKTLTDHTLTPFSADWTITKDGNRALITPCLAVEDGKDCMKQYNNSYEQYIFHKNCYEAHYDIMSYI